MLTLSSHRKAKIFGIILLACLSLILSGCKSEEAQAVDDTISSIGEVSIDSGEKIAEAEKDYDSLSDKDKNSLDNYDELKNARATYDSLMAKEVSDAISQLKGTDVLNNSELNAIEKKYDVLTENQKSLVTNYPEFKSLKETFDEKQIKNVEQLIDSIDMSNVSYGDTAAEQKISEAENAYNQLDNRLKGKVENYQELRGAREEFDALAPVSIISYRLAKNIIGQPTIAIRVKNVSEKIVKSYALRLFCYDEDGVPTKVKFDNFSVLLNDTNALKAGKTSDTNGYWQLYGEYAEMRQVVAFPEEVEFYDGEVWKNPKADMLYAKYNEQLLPLDDAGILSKG